MFAISAIDMALWDLMARLMEIPLTTLLGREQETVVAYASGGFTSYTTDELQSQLAGWASHGFNKVKMKVGRFPADDPQRVKRAREAIGPDVELFVDANGAYSVPQALRLADDFAARGVSWFEEPRPSDDVHGLSQVRLRVNPGISIAGGEYGDVASYFVRMIESQAVDVLQPDVTRCGGFTGLARIAALCEAHDVPISLHCAPTLAMHGACACRNVKHIEYFHDHVRIEQMLFDGIPEPDCGVLTPNRDRPGNGLVLKEADLKQLGVRGRP